MAGEAAALLDDPYDAQGLAAIIERILTDTGYRDELVRRGHGRAQQFSWEEAAKQMIGCYHSVLEGKKKKG